MPYPSRCCYTVELDIWYATICIGLPRPDWLNHSRQKSQVTKVWTWRHSMGDYWRSYQCSRGNIVLSLYSIANTTFQQYKKVTLYFSSDLASIVNVIPAMDKLNTQLNPRKKTVYHPAIIAAMSLACKKLNRYYELTDLPDPYRIAMGKCRYLYLAALWSFFQFFTRD